MGDTEISKLNALHGKVPKAASFAQKEAEEKPKKKTKKQLKEEAHLKEVYENGTLWSAHSEHAKPTYPMGKKAHKLNFPPEEPAVAAKKQAKAKEAAEDKPKRGEAGQRGKQSAAQIFNQERLYEQIEKQTSGPTYIQPDSNSWIEPYNQRDHAWTVGQHDMSNETSWTEDEAAAKGYRSPINGGKHSFAQGPTYIQPDSNSWIEPYNQRDHAWTVGQHDMSNETSWTEDDAAAKGYRSPINGGKHSFAQGPTYIQPDSNSWIEPYNQRDHAWTVG